MGDATVTLPGGGGSFTTLHIGSDAKKAVTDAIKQLFTAAGQNNTVNEIASGVDGDKGFFNAVLDGALKATTITAGKFVQALIDTGLGQDTLVGNASTTLFIGNGVGDSISSMATSTIVGGTGNDTVAVTGSATVYLEGGSNAVNVSSGAVTLAGTGGTDTVNVIGGVNTVSAAYKATVNITGGGTDEIDLAKGSQVNISGSNVTAVITGSNETITITGSNEHINLVGKNDTVIISGGSNDTITYSSSPAAKHGHETASVIGGVGHHVLDAATHVAGLGATLTGGEKAGFTHIAAGGHFMQAAPSPDTLGGAAFKIDLGAQNGRHITPFSSGQEATAHAAHTQYLAALKDTTVVGGAAHTSTMFTANHDKITIIGERITQHGFKGE